MSPESVEFLDLIAGNYAPTVEAPSDSFYSDFRSKRFDDGNVAELLHENTKITGATKRKSERSASLFLNDDVLSFAVDGIDPDFAGYERIPLPEPDETPCETPLFSVLAKRRSQRDFRSGNALTVETLSNLLYHSVGVSGTVGGKTLRRYPSAGGLYPVELYFNLSTTVGDLSPGLYYYVVEDHELQSLGGRGTVEDLFADSDTFDYSEPELTVFLSAAFWRSYAKYGPRAYRYVLQEAGHLCQNLQLVATALELGSVSRAGYLDDEVNEYLGIDGVNEAVVYTTVVGSTSGVSNGE